MSSQRAQFHALFQYAQGPAHLWDSHTSALAEMEKTFQVCVAKIPYIGWLRFSDWIFFFFQLDLYPVFCG